MRRPLLLLAACTTLALAACTSSTPESTTTTAATITTAAAPSTRPSGQRVPQGYRAVTIRVQGADGSSREWCVLVADTPALRGRGLMEVDSLGGYDGMVFRFEQPTSTSFYMFQTDIPLSIAFYDEAGAYVSSTDMTPCPASDGADCPLYSAAAPYTEAVEVVPGDLGRLGLLPGSTLEVTDVDCVR